ncbi:MAG: glycosyltransferase [Leptolyngbyaceae cyanobacterium bins.349]|nr:glycosyltransferase [Leptolyngbyaceae cyanobacterium bins.349]
MAEVKKWSVDLHKLIYTHVVMIGIPTIFYYCLRLGGLALVDVHMAIATFFLVSSMMIILEASNSLFRRYAVRVKRPLPGRDRWRHQLKRWLGLGGYHRRPRSKTPLPRCSILIAAYLPNEQDIILETLRHILNTIQRPAAGLEIILAYNTPVTLPIEDDLHLFAQLNPELQLLRVEGSHSKAENLNAALDHVTGDIVCILDADHHPAPDCFFRAWRWLEQDYDIVQGRNIIRNHHHNLLTQNIAVEFESLYGVSHPAKSFLTDSTIFGGSNGYWRTSVLKQIRFNPTRLTEDIDATMRTLLSGYRILHDRSIIATELAPIEFNSFWFQRKRWAQGWLEVSFHYQRRVWKSKRFTLGQKLYWTYLLYYGVIYSLFALQILPLILSMFLYYGYLPPSDNAYLWFCTLITFFSGFYQTAVTMKVAANRYPAMYFAQHAVLIFAYTTLKNMIAIVAFYDHLHGYNQWVVTSRGNRTSRMVEPESPPVFAPTAGVGSTK